MDEKKQLDGEIKFFYTSNGDISCYVVDRESLLKNYGGDSEESRKYLDFVMSSHYNVSIYHLMSGMEFLEEVDNGGFIDYDGSIAHVFVDNKLSNLGLIHKGMHQGYFMVDADTWKEFCKKHDVQVNWANK